MASHIERRKFFHARRRAGSVATRRARATGPADMAHWCAHSSCRNPRLDLEGLPRASLAEMPNSLQLLADEVIE